MPLNPPAADFSTLELKTKNLSVEKLKRIGRRNSGEPYFGKHGVNRFDDPNKVFGTCYCGQDLGTALAETVLHDELPENGQFKISQDVLDDRFLITYATGAKGGQLKIADLTGASLKRLGGNNALSSDYPYATTQLWSAAVFNHPAKVDGFEYYSKQLNDKKAVVLFDRSAEKFGTPKYTPLNKARGLTQAKNRLGIVAVDLPGAP